jgi:integrase
LDADDWFDHAAAAIGVPRLTPHELRHTAASLAIASGASIKSVRSMLGHALGQMTLDRYGHALADELDAVADRWTPLVLTNRLPDAPVARIGLAYWS